jgi:glycosyltransferase involved in cell wall biosynthesis
MQPDKVLLIRPQSAIDAGLAHHPEWYAEEGLTKVVWNGHGLDARACKRWLEGLDVLYFAETPYDWQLLDWARQRGVRTVGHLMPEYDKHTPNPFNRFPKNLPRPDQWWAPTSWRIEHLPPRTRVVSVPVALDRFEQRPLPSAGAVPRWLHVVGSRAASDRNGTMLFLEAVRYLKGEHVVILRAQGSLFYPQGTVGRNVHLEVHADDLPNWWDLYDGADALVLPRRYGGLCMPAQEAMGAGLALVMPTVSPNEDWPILGVEAPFENAITTSAGSIPLCRTDPHVLARKLDWLGRHPTSLRKGQERARDWAEQHSWAKLEPVIRAELEAVCA